MSYFKPNQIVHMDEDLDVMYMVVHIHGDFAWIEPYGHTGEHKHFKYIGSCKCAKQDIVHTARLSLHIWSKAVQKAEEQR